MRYIDNKAEDVKIAYIGGGSRGWAWGLMSDLATAGDMSGRVELYDIDFEAAKANEVIGNKYNNLPDATSKWEYKAVETIGEALTGADFVIISILPGTFDEMESDVHAPEEYGIYQSVGDTTGPGGVVRAMRTLPMFEEIAQNIKKYSPDAWVINYTNPMTLCVKTLYRVFPEIKAFGCCHEVFGTQDVLAKMASVLFGEEVKRKEIKVNPIGVNHFTWLTKATYRNIDLFRRFGYIAAAGDRHLAEFCEGKWYLESPEKVESMLFHLTPVWSRKDELKERLEKSKRLLSGEEEIKLKLTGEEGVKQMRAILGLGDFVTNVNLPNRGQIPNLPLGAVVETNASFTSGTVTPVVAGEIPKEIYPLISRICTQQEVLSDAIAERNIDKIFEVFANDPLVTCSLCEAKELFNKMVNNTKAYLTDYNLG